MYVPRRRIAMIHNDKVNKDLFPGCYGPVKPQVLYSDSGSMCGIKFFASEPYLIADENGLTAGSLGKADGEPSDHTCCYCGNCTTMGIQPSKKSIKPANQRGHYDWLLGLAVVFSPFIAGFFAFSS
jgi:hypothetical protein